MDEPYLLKTTVCPSGLTVQTVHIPGKDGLLAGEISFRFGSAHATKLNSTHTGITHLIEHNLLFGASRNYAPREVNNLFPEKFGLTHNAGAGQTATYYFSSGGVPHVLTAEDFWAAFGMIVDGTFFPKFDAATFSVERARTANEAVTQLSPEGQLFLNLIAARDGLPYFAQSSLGRAEHLAEYTPEECDEFHKSFYTLPNTLVVLAGDVEHDRDVAKIERLLAGTPEKSPLLPNLEKRYFQMGELRKKSAAGENEGCLRVHVQWPSVNYSDYATRLATDIAIKAASNFMAPKLMTKYGLYHAGIYAFDSMYDTSLTELVVEGGDKSKVIYALQDAVEMITSPELLAYANDKAYDFTASKVKSILVSQTPIQNLANVMTRARLLGVNYQGFGHFETDAIKAVTASDVTKAIARLAAGPVFLIERGHEGVIGSTPSVETISAWRSRPDAAAQSFRQAAKLPSNSKT